MAAYIPTSHAGQGSAPDDVPHRLVVKFKSEAGARLPAVRDGQTGIGPIDELNIRYRVRKLRPLHKAHGARFTRRILPNARPSALEATYVLEFPEDVDVVEAAVAYKREVAHVAYAEPDLIVHAAMTPDDPYYASLDTWGQGYDDLWGLKSDRLDCAPAWDISQGDGVVVAVIDTGADYTHEDLAGSVWINTQEVPDNGIDDDGNGYRDDVRGWDFATFGGGGNDNDPLDGHGHGTHCAGTIAAVGNNATGIVGVAFGARIMVVRGLGDGGTGYSSDLAAAIVYAVDNGADVLSCSWGAAGTATVLDDAFDYAYDNGCVSVVAAGNNNADASNYTPASISNVIAVAATDANDTKASFSNYGPPISVAAPGVDILSLRAAGTSLGTPINDHYTRANGTSMACPHAAGVCALILARTPGIAPGTVRSVLETTANDLGTGGWDLYFGHGRVNANQAMSFDVADLCFADIEQPTPGLLASGAEEIEVSGSAYGDTFSHFYLEYAAASAPGTWLPIADAAVAVIHGYLGSWDVRDMEDGDYVLQLRVLNTDGATFSSLSQIRIDNAAITDPADGQLCNNKDTVVITGRALGFGFQNYVIDIASNHPAPLWSTAGITLEDGGLEPKTNAVLGELDPASIVQSGTYLVRLTVNYAGGRQGVETNKLNVDADLAAGWPTLVEKIEDDYTYHKPYFNLLDPGAGARRLIVSCGTDVIVYSPTGAILNRWAQDPDQLFYPLAVADLDGDGAQEMITNLRLDRIHGVFDAFHADGTSVAGWPVVIDLPGGGVYGVGSSPAVLGDINLDGQLEIVANAFNTSGNMYLYALTSAGDVLPGWPVLLSGTATADATLARLSPSLVDLDGDGRLDVVMGTFTDGLHALQADGTELPGWPATAPLKVVTSAAVGDLNGDGFPEVVVGSTNGEVHVFQRDASPAAGWPVSVDRRAVSEIALADLDGDGHLEVIFSAAYAVPGGTRQWEMLYVYNHDGTPMAGWPQSLSPGQHSTIPVVGDVDGDGDLEIVACKGWTGIAAFHHTGALAWSKDIGENLNGGNAMLLADVDSDGLLELAAGNDEGRAFVWDLPGEAAPWATIKHDGRFTGSSAASYNIHASAGPGGSITPSGDISVGYGGDTNFVVAAASGYYIWDVLVDGNRVKAFDRGDTNYVYTFNNVVDDHTIEALFETNAVARHWTDGYTSPGANTILCDFTYPTNRELLSLKLEWPSSLPPGWTVDEVSGDGGPEVVDGAEIVFSGSLANNPIAFSYTLVAPAGETGAKEIHANVEYQLSGAINPSTTEALPAPLVLRKLLTVPDLAAANKTYDGNATAVISSYGNLSGVTDDDDVTLDTAGAVATFSDALVGIDKTVTVTGLGLTGADADAYTILDPATTADITTRELTVTGATADDKVYDGTPEATISGATLEGILGDDNVSLAALVGAFAQADAGSDISVSPALTLSGSDAGNYTLTQPAGLTADIAALELTVGGSFSAHDKVYDGSAAATIDDNSLSLVTPVGEDVVTLTAVAAFADKIAADGKTVSLGGSTLGGADAANYTLSLDGAPTATADIAALELTVTGAVADDKVYDGTTAATIAGATLAGVLGTDDVSLDALVGAFAQANVGTDISVAAALTLSGTDEGNYTLTQPAWLAADIAARELSVTGAVADDKVYDGTTAATVSAYGDLTGIVGDDDVILDTSGGVATFDNPDVGVDKTVTVSGLSLGGTDADEYWIGDQITTADILVPQVSATHSCVGYQSPGVNPVSCQVVHAEGVAVTSLRWMATLPDGWTLASVAGAGKPRVEGASIVFDGPFTSNVIRFDYFVNVPGGEGLTNAIRGVAQFRFPGMDEPATAAASLDPVIAERCHSSDYRSPYWVIDGTELNRVLSYWRNGAYHIEPFGHDGYAPGEDNTDGFRHSGDYQPLYWQIDEEEAQEALTYWRAGAYEANAASANDGYSPNWGGGAAGASAPPGVAIDETRILIQGPDAYDPGGLVSITNVLEFNDYLLSLSSRPQLPPGWELTAVTADGDPELRRGAILWTSAQPQSPVEMVYTVRVPLWELGTGEIRTEARYYFPGMDDPATVSSPEGAVVLSPRDTDLDGMPDGWERYYSGSATNLAPEADDDHDGMMNLYECLAGTDPQNSNSVLKVRNLAPGTEGEVMIRWNSASNRLYTVAKTTNLLSEFRPLATNLPATPPVNAYEDVEEPANSSFYHIKVENRLP